MRFPSSFIVLFLLGIVASFAAVDLGSTVPDELLSSLSPNDALDTSITDTDSMASYNDVNNNLLTAPDVKPSPNDALNSLSLLAVGVMKSSHNLSRISLLTSGTADGMADGLEVSNTENTQKLDVTSAECITDTLTARKRARRGCISEPKVQPGSHKKNDAQIDGTHNSAVQNGGWQNNGDQQDDSKSPGFSLDLFIPSLDYRIPEKNIIVCNPIAYDDSNIPMCDTGNRIRDVIAYNIGPIKYGLLFSATPCKLIYIQINIHKKRTALPVSEGRGRLKQEYCTSNERSGSESFGCPKPEWTWCCGKVNVDVSSPLKASRSNQVKAIQTNSSRSQVEI
ncbi:hypothetical protein MMC07_004765 [Pseudocyphellaria aurata]|nr:hypothetical protein [Pseudocyphellaria aurata]